MKYAITDVTNELVGIIEADSEIEAVKKMNYNERALSQVLGRKPKISEVATMMGVDEERVRLLQSYLTREPISLEHLNEERFLEEQDD